MTITWTDEYKIEASTITFSKGGKAKTTQATLIGHFGIVSE
jgi:hypothetical protein